MNPIAETASARRCPPQLVLPAIVLILTAACTIWAAEEKVPPAPAEAPAKEAAGTGTPSAKATSPEATKTETPSPELAAIDREREAIAEVLVTALRGESSWLDTPNTAHSISANRISNERLARTLPDALAETPGVMVQKTSQGQGSPYLRGFTGFRTLMLVDGIRLNNAAFREGPNQYWSTIDALSVDRLEVVKGPSSVLYGSDAVGGTVNAITRSREGYEPGCHWDRRVYYRYSTAENSQTVRGEVSGNLDDRLGVLLGTSYKNFGNVDGGRDVGRQSHTGYEDFDADLKLEYFLDPSHDRKVVLAHQHVDQDDAWRSHATVYGLAWEGSTVGTDRKRVLDQNRDLTYLQYHAKNLGGFFDAIHLSASVQTQEEFEKRTQANGRFTHQGFRDMQLGLSAVFETPSQVGRWTYGVEYYYDWVDARRTDFNANGTLRASHVQGPLADGASYGLFGAFVQDEIPVTDRLDVILGVRYTHARADAGQVEDPTTGGQFSIKNHWDSVVGSARTNLRLDQEEHWALFGGVSQGFRAPNLSDLTRFDLNRTGEVETPQPDLDPEKFIQYEIGLKTEYKTFRAQAAYFITDIEDMIVRTPTGVFLAGFGNEVTKRNAGRGWMHGVELEASWQVHPQWRPFAGFTYQDGEVDGFPTAAAVKRKEPISRLMPPSGFVGLRWDSPKKVFWAEVVGNFVHSAHQLSSADRADTQRIPIGGTPGYNTLTLRGGWNVDKNLSIFAALDNVTNEDYRVHGSGVNEPGRNFVVGLDYRF